MEKRKKITLFITLLLTLSALSAFAAEYMDVVYLENGSRVKGIIIEQIPGETISIETVDGSVFVFKVEEVVKIAKEKVEKSSDDGGTSQKTEINITQTTDVQASGSGGGGDSDTSVEALRAAEAFVRSLITPKIRYKQLKKVQIPYSELEKLDATAKQGIYDDRKKDNAGIIFLLNFLLPSVGSWIQGNYGVAMYDLTSTIVYMIAAPILISRAAEATVSSVYDSYYYSDSYYTSTTDYYSGSSYEDPTKYYVAAGVLGLNFLIARLTALISPFTHQRKYNDMLRKKLQY